MAYSSDDEVHSLQYVDAESDLYGNFDSHEEETARKGVQHAQPSSSATYNADWLSDLIGEAYAVLYKIYCCVFPALLHSSLRMQATCGIRSCARPSRSWPGIYFLDYCRKLPLPGCTQSR